MHTRVVLKNSTIKYNKRYYKVPEELIGKKVVINKHGKYLDITINGDFVVRHLDKTPPQKYTNTSGRRFKNGGTR